MPPWEEHDPARRRLQCERSGPRRTRAAPPLSDPELREGDRKLLVDRAVRGDADRHREETIRRADLADAAAWTVLSSFTAPGVIDPGDKRYVQFQAELRSDSTALLTISEKTM